jgi:hypothetical protein
MEESLSASVDFTENQGLLLVLAFQRSVGHAKIKLAVNTAYRPQTNEAAKPSN